MTHSATFDNYKRHVQAQQQQHWYVQSQPMSGSRQSQQGPKNHPVSSGTNHHQKLYSATGTVPQSQQATILVHNNVAGSTGLPPTNPAVSTQRSLSHAVASAA